MRAGGIALVLAFVVLWDAAAAENADGNADLDREGLQYAPYLEWRLGNPSYEGNPYDLIALATFEHEKTGEKRTTGMYYDGDNGWCFRFTGTRVGLWSFVTKSDDPDLDGKRGRVDIAPNPDPNIKGFITHVGSKWARPVGADGELEAFVPQLVMCANLPRLHNNPEKIDADIETFLVQHGFNGFHVMGSCHWFDLNVLGSDEIESDDPNPDPRTFEAAELLITKTHAAGGMVHFWMWGDEQRHWTPVRWGKNGDADRRLQRYLAARLGPLPGWSMGYGFDNFEWVEEADLRLWHEHLHEQFGWPHLLGARNATDRLEQIYDGLDYSSYEQHRPDYRRYVEVIDLHPGKPSFSEDRFRIRAQNQFSAKDYDMDMTRRGLWHSTMAGGVANIWGCLGDQDSDLGSKPYPNPEWIKTWSEFLRDRFTVDMTRAERVADSPCLARPTRAHYVIYKEDAETIALDLSGMDGAQTAVAVDTKKPYAPIDLGELQPEGQTWTAPYVSDWALAIGRFE